MEIRLMVTTVVGGHGPVVRSGRVQRCRIEVCVEHVSGRRRCGRHGQCLYRRRVLDGRGRGHRRCRRRGAGRQFPFRPASGQKVP